MISFIANFSIGNYVIVTNCVWQLSCYVIPVHELITPEEQRMEVSLTTMEVVEQCLSSESRFVGGKVTVVVFIKNPKT